MRLFVAVDLDDGVRGVVGGLIARMRTRAGEEAGRTRISWVAPERLHLTLHFFPHVETADGARIAAAMTEPMEIPAFDVAFGGVGTFPPRSRARVIWLGVREGVESLVKLHGATGARLRAVGLDLEARPFAPHLTLARLREGVSARTLRSIVADDADSDVGVSRVEAVRLYESRLGAGGPTHTVLAAGLLQK